MSKNFQDSKSLEVSCLDYPTQNEGCLHQNFFSYYNKNSTFEETTGIIWSREKKIYSENAFNTNEGDSFSDFSGRSTSSCSWNNDDFDMISSSKVSQSLEAVDNALYEKQQSPFISEEVFKECCEWSNKFPYIRLKGEKIVKPVDDVFLNSNKNENETYKSFENSFNLHVEGKKMALHQPDKTSRRVNFKVLDDSGQATCSEKNVINNDENFFTLPQCETMHPDVVPANLLKHDDITNVASLNVLHEKIIEKLAQNTWPKVLEILQHCQSGPKTENFYEDFKLPPIVATQIEQKQYVTLQRPRTEGTSSSGIDFPTLSSALLVSPKVLQDKTGCRSGKFSLRSSRPTSEIYLSRRKNMFSNISSKISSQKAIYQFPNTSKQLQLTSNNKGEKEDDTISLYLPALEEDITDPIGYLKGISLQTETKTVLNSEIPEFPKKTECFLPPISMNKLHPHFKLTHNLFTFYGSDLKATNNKEVSYNPKTPTAHSNFSTSKKVVKQQEESNYKFLKENLSSLSNSSQLETKRIEDNVDTQVTLFPIVTSLTPNKEKKSSSGKRSICSFV